MVVCLVATFGAVLLDRVLRYQELAEKVAMEATLGSLRSALTLQASARILRGRMEAVAELADENPMDWLADRPSGYVGVRRPGFGSPVTGGSWYFDPGAKELAYRPQRTRYLTPGPDGSDELRFKVVVRIGASPGNAPAAEISELGVRALPGAQWTPEFH